MDWLIKKIPRQEIPGPLQEIPQPPKSLYLVGELADCKKEYLLCVVGSRKYSSYGREVVEKIIFGLGGQPITIVSGLALGIDSLAHQAALQVGLKTLALPGSGLDQKVLYPSANRRLAEKIVAAGGGLLSEYEPNQAATLYTFPQRNRLMAGLSKATLIIEAGAKSGTLITARLATEYNRDVLAVPGSIFSPNSHGPNWLIKQGAIPVTSAEDVLVALGLQTQEDNKVDLNFSDLSPDEKIILELLQIESLDKEALIAKLGLKPSQANITLSMMEIRGLIKEAMGEIHLKN